MHPLGRLLVYLFDWNADVQPPYRPEEDAPDWSPRRAAAWRTWAAQRNGPAEESAPVAVGLEPTRLSRHSEDG